MTLPLLIETLDKSLDNRKILSNITFSLAPGTITALLGPNGAGKTTLIGCILGLLAADRGLIRLWGETCDALQPDTRMRIGFVPQTMTGLSWFRVRELKDYLARYRDRENEREDPVWENWAQIDPEARIKSLSGGERQRLAIVLALRFSPDFIILDEPVASLDPAARHDFIRLLRSYARRRGATVLISSHIISDLETICDRFLILQTGKIIMDLEASSIAESVRHLARWPEGSTDTALSGLDILAHLPDGSVWVRNWTQDHERLGLETVPADMESLFLALTR